MTDDLTCNTYGTFRCALTKLILDMPHTLIDEVEEGETEKDTCLLLAKR